jgi:hypothetical protein
MRALFASSWRMLRAHPIVSAALGGAIVLSMASILIGIGALVTPWFICEIFGLQLSMLTDRPVVRTRAWIRAGVLVLGMVGLVLAATWLAALAIGPDVSTADSAAAPLPWPEAMKRTLMIAGVTALTAGFIAPFSYAPLILIERGGRIGEAALESAWLVRRGGFVRHLALVFLAQMLPLAPALVAAVVVARTFERAATPLGVLVGLTLVPLSIPFGQGLLTASYVQRAPELPVRRWTRRESEPPLALRALLALDVMCPVIALSLLFVGAVRPLPPAPGRAIGELVLDAPIERERTLYIPGTTLEIDVVGERLAVRTQDSRLEARVPSPIERVRVLRVRDAYAIEARARARSWTLEVNGAGVRVDDSIGLRVVRRVPAWALAAIAVAFGLSALLFARALEPLGATRRAYGAPARARPPLAVLRAERRTAMRRAWTIALVLAPSAVLALAVGLGAALGP